MGEPHIAEYSGNYKELQKWVGGLIELVRFNECDAFINEEGKLIGLEVNPFATFLYETMIGRDVICGPMVLTGPADDEGETTELSQEVADTILAIYNTVPVIVTRWAVQDLFSEESTRG